jgi:hypothetical protein
MVSARVVALSAVAIGVLGLATYLLVQVRTNRADDATSSRPVTTAAAGAGSDAIAATRPSPAHRAPLPTIAATAPATPPVPAAGQDGSDDDAGSAIPTQPPVAAAAPPTRPRSLLPVRIGHATSKQGNDHMVSEADQALQAGDLDRANAVASQVVAQSPNNVRALDVLALTACARGDQPAAQGYYDRLPAVARGKVKAACTVQLQDPP